MMPDTEFKVYSQYRRLINTHDKKTVAMLKNNNSSVDDKTTMTSIIMWTYIKGQRIDLDVLFESILLNGSSKHIAFLQYLMGDKNTKNDNKDD
jgi:hypothetical protein